VQGKSIDLNLKKQNSTPRNIYYQTEQKQPPLAPSLKKEYNSAGKKTKKQPDSTSSEHSSTDSAVKPFKDPHLVIDKYRNLPFVPQKNEQTDRNLLLRSKELNPMVSFPI